LLGAGMHSHFNYDSHNEPVPKGRGNNANAAEYYPEYDRAQKLGKAVTTMTPVGNAGLYRRRWERGWVYVNPAEKAANIQLDGTFEDLDGRQVNGIVTLPPHNGQIFLNQ